MQIIHKIIFILISLIISSFLFFATFVTHNLSSFEKPYYQDTKKGVFQILEEKENFILTDSTINYSGSILINKLNIFDKVLSKYGKLNVNDNGEKIQLDITSGIYYFQLEELTGNYIISNKGFNIVNNGPGSFIINTLNPRKNIIFSNNTVLSLDLKNIKTGEKVTNIILYPHEYLIFNPLKNIFVKNSDLLKITQTYTLGFFNKEIMISDDFLKLILVRSNKGTTFIKTVFRYLKYEKDNSQKYINNFTNSTFGTLPGEKFIDIYSKIFINKKKQISYLKNKIIRKLNDITLLNKVDIKKNEEIINLLSYLKNTDKESYKEIIQIIKFHYFNTLSISAPINSKVNFTSLINKIEKTHKKGYLSSLIFLEEIFKNYNSKNYYKDINLFTYKYLTDLEIDITGNINKNGEKIEYLLFFLEKIMLNVNINGNINNITNLINLFNNYINIANTYYSNSNNNIKRIGIFTYSKILNKFIDIINSAYFKEKENNLLIIKDNINISKKDLLTLQKNINIILNFYKHNTGVLDIKKSNKDKFLLKKLYPKIEQQYKELFYALNDYEEYLSIYDVTKKELLSSKSINENIQENNILNIRKATQYLKTFNGTNLNNINIQIMDYIYCLDPTEENQNIKVSTPYCYKIDNLYIDKQNVSFLLFPYLQNKISNIKIGNTFKKGTYKLDNIQSELDEKLKTAKKDKERYMFQNFLLNIFSQKTEIKDKQENTNDTSSQNIKQEDTIIRTFKRNKLLGKYGDFANLEAIRINYNDLIVIRKGKHYKINITNSYFNIHLSKDIVYNGYFSSEYNFSNKHSFINPKIKLIDNKSKRDLLLGNNIYITGEYKVNKIGEELKQFFYNYKRINFILNNIIKTTNNNKVDILYDKKTKIITFKTKYNNKVLIIKFLDSSIKSIVYNGIIKIQNSINYRFLSSTLNNIIKK